MKYILFFCVFIVNLLNIYGENITRIYNGGSLIDSIVGWVMEFEDKQLRMPESMDELLEKLPQYRSAFEYSQKNGYIVSYTCIDTHSMIIKVQDKEDIYECYKKLNIYYYFLNNTFVSEYNVDLYKNLPPPVPPLILEEALLYLKKNVNAISYYQDSTGNIEKDPHKLFEMLEKTDYIIYTNDENPDGNTVWTEQTTTVITVIGKEGDYLITVELHEMHEIVEEPNMMKIHKDTLTRYKGKNLFGGATLNY